MATTRRPQINHRACDHAATPEARKACRKAHRRVRHPFTAARVGKGKAIHLYFAGSQLVACGADGMVAGTATPCAGEVTCKRCLAS